MLTGCSLSSDKAEAIPSRDRESGPCSHSLDPRRTGTIADQRPRFRCCFQGADICSTPVKDGRRLLSLVKASIAIETTKSPGDRQLLQGRLTPRPQDWLHKVLKGLARGAI